MFEFAKKAIEIAGKKRADFADIRIIEDRRRSLSVKNGEIAGLNDTTTLGFGVRVLYRGSWGFAALLSSAR
jgi:TldD protein